MAKICNERNNIECELVSGEDISRLEWRIMMVIDSIGLPESQETAQKDVVGLLLWDWFKNIIRHKTDHSYEKMNWYNGMKNIPNDSGKAKKLKVN